MMVIFLDISKAFEMAWKDSVIMKLSPHGITGRALIWIKSFLQDRQITVKVNTTLSDWQPWTRRRHTSGISDKSNTLQYCHHWPLNHASKHVQLSRHLPWPLCWRLSNMESRRQKQRLVKHLQHALNNLKKWSIEWGFNFSPEETVAVQFAKNKKIYPYLSLGNRQIDFKRQARYLGMIYEDGVTWRSHIEYIISRCNQRLNLMGIISGNTWGTDRKTLLSTYKALVRPILDYGYQAYNSCSHYLKDKLDTI